MYFSLDSIFEKIPGIDKYILEFANYPEKLCSEIPKSTLVNWDDLIR